MTKEEYFYNPSFKFKDLKDNYVTLINCGVDNHISKKGLLRLVDEHLELENKYFNLYDRHLAQVESLVKEREDLKIKYNKILDDVHDYRHEVHCMKMTIRNLCKHFGVKSENELQNIYLCKPYKFEDLKEGMWVWDDRLKACFLIKAIKPKTYWNIVVYANYLTDTLEELNFEENRFYPVSKAMEG